MKKLLFVINQLYKGGAETSLVNLLNQLDYTQYSVELLILDQSPIKGAVSLIDRINKKILICDAYAEYQNINLVDKIRAKLIYTLPQKGAYYFTALDFVKNKYYDWSFFIGEWCSPSFVANEVNSNIKAAWIHNDLSEAEYFNAENYFYFADMFDYFIFVSKNSLETSVNKYPFIKDKALVIYNINDSEYIKKRSMESIDPPLKHKKPILLTCANFRPQKNHYRQAKAMAILKKRGFDFLWLNIGATTDEKIILQVKEICDENGLTDSFLILGPKENPYKYMEQADVITVLSDYESWSMVITEAKILGKPIIATKTSGALEQIEDGKTGVLVDFNEVDIADKIQQYFEDSELQQRITSNVKSFDNTTTIVKTFESLLTNGRSYKNTLRSPQILYVIDDINYLGGAHIATKLQIKAFLKLGYDISVFSTFIPTLKVREELQHVRFLSFSDFKENQLFQRRIFNCLVDHSLDNDSKKRKINYTYKSRITKKFKYDVDILPYLQELFSLYDIVCLTSESSSYKSVVAASNCKKKIQWIHTDYCNWKNKNDWTRAITENDGELYRKFDTIVVLTEGFKKSFINLYPHLKEKIIVNHNLIPIKEIQEKANKVLIKNITPVNFITVGQMDYPKAYSRLVNILFKLKMEGYNFTWTIIGDGNQFNEISSQIQNLGLKKQITLTGALENPFIKVKKADVFALLSDYEGLPNTIYEALILGVPVLATDVGGISTQIVDGISGWLVDNNEKAIYRKLKYLLMNQKEIGKIKINLKSYSYDNDLVQKINKEIFSISK